MLITRSWSAETISAYGPFNLELARLYNPPKINRVSPPTACSFAFAWPPSSSWLSRLRTASLAPIPAFSGPYSPPVYLT